MPQSCLRHSNFLKYCTVDIVMESLFSVSHWYIEELHKYFMFKEDDAQ